MLTSDQTLLFVPAAMLVAAGPGANNLLALINGARSGVRPAVGALAGRFAAFALMILMVAFGLGALLAASETAFVLIKWLGVGYLVYLAVRLWRDAPPPAGEGTGGTPARALARREFVTALTNPKAVLLFTAFLPQFVRPGEPATAQLLALGAIYMAVEFVAAAGYALLRGSLRRLDLTAARMRLVNRVSAGMMLTAAGLLAASRRSA